MDFILRFGRNSPSFGRNSRRSEPMETKKRTTTQLHLVVVRVLLRAQKRFDPRTLVLDFRRKKQWKGHKRRQPIPKPRPGH